MTSHSTLPVAAIVVAAGSGSRLGGDVPKALRRVGGRPLVVRAVEQMAAGGVHVAIVIVADGTQGLYEEALEGAPIPWTLITGGEARQDSVAQGVELLRDGAEVAPELAGAGVVLVHDAARAFVPADMVGRVIEAVEAGADAVVPVIPVVDTVRAATPTGSVGVDRAPLRSVQTPQGFRRSALVRAYDALRASGTPVTDDVTAAELAGFSVVMVDGDPEAFKVTRPFDMAVAEALVAEQERS